MALATGLVLSEPSAGHATEIEWRGAVDIARGGGQRGPWRQNDSHYDFVDDPVPAFNTRGELAVAWVDQQRKAVLLQRYAADGTRPLAAPVDVSRQPRTFSWLPRLAWAPDDAERLYVIWQEIIFSGGSHGGEMMFAASDDGGRTFAPPLNLSNSREGDGKGRIDRDTWHNGSYDLAAAPGGRVLAAWTEYDGRLWVTRSGDGGRSFGKPRLVDGEPPGLPARAPALAVRSDGRVALAWSTGDDPAGDLRIALSSDGGERFGAPRTVAVTPGYSDAPKLAFDGRGHLHLVHAESRGGPFGPSTIHHRRSTDGGRSFGPPRDIAAPMPGGSASAGFPMLDTDARGRLIVAWELFRAAGQAPHGLGIAVSDDGERFSAPQRIPGSVDPGGGFNGSTQGLLMDKLTVGPDGRLAVVNSALKPGSHSRVWLMRGTVR